MKANRKTMQALTDCPLSPSLWADLGWTIATEIETYFQLHVHFAAYGRIFPTELTRTTA
jgi:hypothetical protein